MLNATFEILPIKKFFSILRKGMIFKPVWNSSLEVFQCTMSDLVTAKTKIITGKDPNGYEIIIFSILPYSRPTTQHIFHHLTFALIMMIVHVLVAFSKYHVTLPILNTPTQHLTTAEELHTY